MIRIRLLSGRKGYRRHTLVFAIGLVAAALLLAGIYWVDQRFPVHKALNDLFAGAPGEDLQAVGGQGGPPALVPGEGKEAEEPEEENARGVKEVSRRQMAAEAEKPQELAGTADPLEKRASVDSVEAPAEPTAPMEDEAAGHSEKPQESKEAPVPPQPRGDGQVEKASEPAHMAVEGEPGRRDLGRTPRLSEVCMEAFRLFGRVPSGMRFTALISNASGEYIIEGSSSSQELAELFLDTLNQLPSRAELSWLCNKGREEQSHKYKFAMQGHIAAENAGRLEPLSSTEARSMFRKVAIWARASGLGAVAVEEPILADSPASPGQHRQKMWASGSYRQIGAFLQTFEQAGARAALGEMVVVPVGRSSRRARLYTAVDVLVR